MQIVKMYHSLNEMKLCKLCGAFEQFIKEVALKL